MVGWHNRLSGHEFKQTPGDSEGQVAWHAAVHGVTKSRTRHSDSTTTKASQNPRRISRSRKEKLAKGKYSVISFEENIQNQKHLYSDVQDRHL